MNKCLCIFVISLIVILIFLTLGMLVFKYINHNKQLNILYAGNKIKSEHFNSLENHTQHINLYKLILQELKEENYENKFEKLNKNNIYILFKILSNNINNKEKNATILNKCREKLKNAKKMKKTSNKDELIYEIKLLISESKKLISESKKLISESKKLLNKIYYIDLLNIYILLISDK